MEIAILAALILLMVVVWGSFHLFSKFPRGVDLQVGTRIRLTKETWDRGKALPNSRYGTVVGVFFGTTSGYKTNHGDGIVHVWDSDQVEAVSLWQWFWKL